MGRNEKSEGITHMLASKNKGTLATDRSVFIQLSEHAGIFESKEPVDEFFNTEAENIPCIKAMFNGPVKEAWSNALPCDKDLVWKYITSYYKLLQNINYLDEAGRSSATYGFQIFIMSAKDLIKDCAKVRVDFDMEFAQGGTTHKVAENKGLDSIGVSVNDTDHPYWEKGITYSKAPLDKQCHLICNLYEESTNEFLGRADLSGHVLKSVTMDFGREDKPQFLSCYAPLTPRKNAEGVEEPSMSELGCLHVVICTVEADLETLKKNKVVTHPPEAIPRMFNTNIAAFSINSTFSRMSTGGGMVARNPLASFHDRMGGLSRGLSHHGDINDPPKTKVEEAKEELVRELEREAKEKEEKLAEEATMTEAEKAKMLDMKRRVTEELIATEKSYCSVLKIIHTYWVEPLKQKVKDKQLNITQENANYLTSNWQTLNQLHVTLLEDITDPAKSVGEAFVKFSDYLKLYSVYLDGYSKIISTLDSLKSNKKFRPFLYLVLQNIEAAGLGSQELTSYLIQPVQRVPRYVMLLKEIRKHTSASAPDYENLTIALKRVKTSAIAINESKRNMENMTKLLEISDSISNLPKGFQIIIPHRKFIRHSSMQSIKAKKSLMSTIRTSDREVYLFSDVMLWTNKSKQYKGHVNLSAVTVGAGVAADTFEVTTSSCYLILKCTEHDSWVDELTKTINELKRAREEKRTLKMNNMKKRNGASLSFGAHQRVASLSRMRTQNTGLVI